VRRSPVERGRDDPAFWFRKRSEVRCDDGVIGYEGIGRWLNAHVVEPDDAFFALRKLGTVVVVIELKPIVMVRLEVTMDNGFGVVFVRFVDMLWRNACRQHEPRHKRERDGCARQRMHGAIMGHAVSAGQTRVGGGRTVTSPRVQVRQAYCNLTSS